MQLDSALEQLQARYSRTRIPVFLDWWSRQLLSMVPARWRRLLVAGESRVWLRPGPEGVAVVSLAAGSREVSTIAPDALAGFAEALEQRQERRPRWMLVPEASLLRRRMQLPSAAAGRLREVLAHEVDRQTPFRGDQVAFDARVLGRDPSGARVEVELVVLPLATLDRHLATLGPLAAQLRGVDVETADGHLGVNLLPPARRAARRDRFVWINLALAAVVLGATWFMLWQSLENRRQAVAELSAEVEQRRNEARRVSALREQLDAAAGGATFLVGLRAERPRMLEVLDDVSARLPDGTWLERLTINQNRITLIGLSNEASGTIAWLQPSPFLETPALAGAVQPDPRSGAQRFTLTAGLRVPAAADPAAEAAAQARVAPPPGAGGAP
ncbi:MAG: PilN domain-containing protein [Lysobacteraceae bacterium]